MEQRSFVRWSGVGLLILGIGASTPAGCADERVEPASTTTRSAPAGRRDPVGALLARAQEQPARREDGALVIEAAPRGGATGVFRTSARPVRARLGAAAEAPSELSLHDGATISFTRRGVHGAARIADGVVHLGAPGDLVEAKVFATGAIVEELFVTRSREVELGYDVTLPAGWRLASASDDAIRVLDAAGTDRAHLTAQRAWDATGAPVEVALAVDARGVRLDVLGAGTLPITIDPAWADASVPLKLRRAHTATMMPSGLVLVAGGFGESSAELYDPNRGTSRFVGALGSVRANHTATLLPDGRVLVTGGHDGTGALATTEIFDPTTETFSPGPDMSETRTLHAATLLDDDRVLVVGKDGAELFDPASDAFDAPGALAATMPADVATARLADGRVLVLGSTTAQLFDPADDTFTTTGGPTALQPGGHTLTTLDDGRVLLLGGCPCFSTGANNGSSNVAELFDPAADAGAGAFAQTSSASFGRLGHTATLLPSGKVLVTGGDDFGPSPEETNAELYDPQSGTFSTVPEQMSDTRGLHTATLLPSGDVLLLGGEQATAELYLGGGAASSQGFVDAGTLLAGRAYHTATTLLDGTVLLAGGELDTFNNVDPPGTERFDPATDTSAPTGELGTHRRDHTATLLPDGRVFLAGGEGGGVLASTELYDPSGAGTFSAGPTLAAARKHHTATLLADGRVLLVGGEGSPDTAELFDPGDDSVTATAGAPSAMIGHAAARLVDGRVLLVSGSAAQLYDPRTDSFRPTTALGAARGDVGATLLPSGEVLVAGGSTLAGELFDPTTELFSFTGNGAVERRDFIQIATPTGRVVVQGGHIDSTLQPVSSTADVYEPLLRGFYALPNPGVPRSGGAATVLRNGEVLLTGGFPCLQLCVPIPTDSAQRLSPDLGQPNERPALTVVPATVQGGEVVTISGARLRGKERSDGGSSSSSAALPVVIFRPLEGGGVITGSLTDVTPTSATWHVPVTGLTGRGLLHVAVGGVLSDAVDVTIEPAPDATTCTLDAQCESGFCADGVCCDAACTGPCEGCTAARKGSGDDGVCGAVPADRDPDDACEVSQGAPCEEDAACATGFCVDGVCCLSTCGAQCEACDVPGSVGTCVPVVGAPHGDRAACDAEPPTDGCEARLCDGVDRTACAAQVGPCTPYACGATACFDACEDDAQCATGHHCEEGACVLGSCDGGSIATTPDGQEVDCAPYRCQPDGSCRTSCAEVGHCVEPNACNFDGACVPRPAPDVDPGCSCELAGGPRSPSGGAWLVFAGVLALGARARRRRGALAACLGLASLLGPGSARAQAPAPTEGAPPAPAPEAPEAPAPPPPAAPAAPSPEAGKAEAKERFDKGIALVAQQSWSAALAEFAESRRLFPTRTATQNAAYCLRQLGRFDEALDLYEGALREFADMDDAKKKEIQKSVAELRALVGAIDFDAGEPGATIVIDGRQRGTYPPEGPLRVAAGSHVVRVFKKGFQPFEARVDVAGRGTARLDATLSPLTESGTLRIEEEGGQKLTVLVDNVEVGETPFEAALAVGPHVVVLRGEGDVGTPPTAAPVELSRTTSLRLRAVKLDARLRVEPTPAAALVTIDAVPVGRGLWEGALPSGKHQIEITADGFLGQRREVSLGAGPATVLAVPLARDEDDDRWRVPSKITVEAGGSLGLFPSFFGDADDGCGDACAGGFGLGALANLHVAYELGGGLGFGVTGGFFHGAQSIEGRTASVRPVGLPAREGAVDDELSLTGAIVAGHASYHFDGAFPVLTRLGVGALFGSLTDRRTGSFQLDDGFTYQAGPVEQSAAATYLVVDPEVRVGYPVTESLELSLGLQVLFLVALERPRWDSNREVDAAVDGIGAFEGEDLTGALWVVAAPGLSARYAF